MHRYKILVPVSFGQPSDVALRHARSIAKQVNAMITCLHVIDHQGLINGKLLSREEEQKIRRESELKLATKVNGIFSGDDSVPFELVVSSGKVHWKILEKATEFKMDLIIMGRSELSDSTKAPVGSTATSVIENANIPVLITSHKEPCSFQHVLVPLDLSAPMRLLLAKAIEMALLLKARVTLCTMLHSSKAQLENVYLRRLHEIANFLATCGISCRSRMVVTDESMVDRVLSCLESYHPDVMLFMTQKESETDELSLGTTANELISRSGIPVLTITPVIEKEFYPYGMLTEYISTPISPDDPFIPSV